MSDPCEKCGKHYEIGDWPFCPHGTVRGGITRDEIPGGFVQENFGHEPETFYSWSAMRKRADELGLQPYVKRLEKTNESAMIDRYTLDSAQALVSRQSHINGSDSDPARLETLQTSIRDVKWSDIE